MSESDPIGADARRAAHLRRLGPLPHLCAFCPHSDPLELTAKPLAWVAKRVRPRVLEDHHVVGRQHDGQLIVLLCRNCHDRVHRHYLDAGVDLRFETDPIERVAKMLDAMAVFDEQRAEASRRWAASLRKANHHGREDH